MSSLFYIPAEYAYVFFGATSIPVLCPFVNQIILVLFCLLLNCRRSLYILNIKLFIRDRFCRYFLPFHGLPFHFFNGFLFWAEAFYLMKFHMSIFAFVVCFHLILKKA